MLHLISGFSLNSVQDTFRYYGCPFSGVKKFHLHLNKNFNLTSNSIFFSLHPSTGLTPGYWSFVFFFPLPSPTFRLTATLGTSQDKQKKRKNYLGGIICSFYMGVECSLWWHLSTWCFFLRGFIGFFRDSPGPSQVALLGVIPTSLFRPTSHSIHGPQ